MSECFRRYRIPFFVIICNSSVSKTLKVTAKGMTFGYPFHGAVFSVFDTPLVSVFGYGNDSSAFIIFFSYRKGFPVPSLKRIPSAFREIIAADFHIRVNDPVAILGRFSFLGSCHDTARVKHKRSYPCAILFKRHLFVCLTNIFSFTKFHIVRIPCIKFRVGIIRNISLA